MVSTYDITPAKLLALIADELKKITEIKPPAWARFCKTANFKERPPVDKDWWYMRAASILRKVSRLGPIGTFKLRTVYGGKGSGSMAEERTEKSAGNHIRKILQQLETAGFLKQAQKKVHKGRILTPKGISLLDKCSAKLSKETKHGKVQTPKQEEAIREEIKTN